MRNSAKQVFAGGWSKTASAVHTTNISQVFGLIESYFIHPAGTMIFLVIGTNVEVRGYSINHDVATIGAVITTFPITVDTSPNGIAFGDHGGIMIITGDTNKILYSYTLPTPYDVDSIVSAPTTMLLSVLGTSAYYCEFSRDGDYVFVSDASTLFHFHYLYFLTLQVM